MSKMDEFLTHDKNLYYEEFTKKTTPNHYND
jgi:hypothetical protein